MCAIDGLQRDGAEAYRAELVQCTPPPVPAAGWLIAPAPNRTPPEGAHLGTLTGHSGGINAAAWSPDGTHLATADNRDGTVRIWDTTTGRPAGPQIVHLSDGEIAVFDGATGALTGATDGAWRWLGWTVVEDGRLTRLPAETFGLLPPLEAPA